MVTDDHDAAMITPDVSVWFILKSASDSPAPEFKHVIAHDMIKYKDWFCRRRSVSS